MVLYPRYVVMYLEMRQFSPSSATCLALSRWSVLVVKAVPIVYRYNVTDQPRSKLWLGER